VHVHLLIFVVVTLKVDGAYHQISLLSPKECQTILQEMSDSIPAPSMHCQMFYMIKSVMEADFQPLFACACMRLHHYESESPAGTSSKTMSRRGGARCPLLHRKRGATIKLYLEQNLSLLLLQNMAKTSKV
jgi:hypothetical protein